MNVVSKIEERRMAQEQRNQEMQSRVGGVANRGLMAVVIPACLLLAAACGGGGAGDFVGTYSTSGSAIVTIQTPDGPRSETQQTRGTMNVLAGTDSDIVFELAPSC